GRADFRRGVRAHRRRAGHRDAVHRAVHLRNRVRRPGAHPRPCRRGLDAGGRGVTGADARAARPDGAGEAMMRFLRFLTARRGRARPDITDWLSWLWLALGVLVMFGPV